MSLDVYLKKVMPTEIYSDNITHNLNKMAAEAGIYEALWRPDEIGITHAHQLIPILEEGLAKLRANPEHFEQFNPPNGWGSYTGLVVFVRDYLDACKCEPNALVEVSR
jgi:hypothetical protein